MSELVNIVEDKKTKQNTVLLLRNYCSFVFSYTLITATYVNNCEEAFEKSNTQRERLL